MGRQNTTINWLEMSSSRLIVSGWVNGQGIDRIQVSSSSLARHLSRSAADNQQNNFDQSDDVVNGKYDLIGPPRAVTNLRPVKFAISQNESTLEKRLRGLRQETQKFNQDWWTKHNTDFKLGREEFIKEILRAKYPNEPDKTTLSADEMSIFYREFMNKHWRNHLDYNKEWQKRNWSIIWLMLRVRLQNFLQRKS